MDEMDEIVQEFLVESTENLDQLDRDLLALEADPSSREVLSSAFRTIHTIKGTSGFLAFARLEQLTHTGESLLARLRDGHLTMTTPAADALLRMADTVRTLLRSIEADGTEGEVAIEPVLRQLRAQLDPDPADADVAVAAEPKAEPKTEPETEPEPEEQPVAAPTAEAKPAAAKRSAAESSLRVDVDLLDTLMRLAGELVLTRNQLVRGVGELADPGLSRTAQRLNVITTDLQESIMKTRMQPIEHVWSKLPRVVRDLGAQCGRRVRLAMTGQDTELDRALLEAIKDPLTHLVRNAVDHGIEDPQVRAAAGKPEEGLLSLRAYHDSGQVVVEVADDGAGMDPAKISAKAVERGIRTAAELAQSPDAEILQLVFEPGFSTAAAVTNVSGRGVGMDVVKTNVEAIGGEIEIESTPGEGTVCRLRVPLTLAIVAALTVECGRERYAIPQTSLLELVATDPAQTAARIEEVAGAPVYRLRGTLLPLIALADVLADSDASAGTEDGPQVIAVLQAGSRRFGLLVDRVVNTEEIVVKALSPRLKDIGVYSGATILGDGAVALILDVQSLARRTLRADAAERAAGSQDAPAGTDRRAAERLLIAGIGDGTRVAIPMSMVTRLEMISADAVETVGGRELVRYRGQIIPLIRLDRHLGVYSDRQPAELPLAVYSRAGHSVAIVMDEIVDIVEHDGQVRSDVDAPGFVGSVVVKDRIVGRLDVERAILAADPGFFESAGPVPNAEAGTEPDPTVASASGTRSELLEVAGR